MNILFLSTKSPFPPKEGHTLRTFNLLKQAAQKHRIFFLTFFLSKEEAENFSVIKNLCVSAKGYELSSNQSFIITILLLIRNVFSFLPFVCQKYRSQEMIREIRKILETEKIDLVHVDMLPLMNYLDTFKGTKAILVDHNVESLLLKRQARHTNNIIGKIFFGIQYLKLCFFEKRMIGKANCCVAVSEQDKEVLLRMNKKASISVVPNGVDIDYFSPSKERNDRNKIVFVGGLNWFPNLDGVIFFCEQVLPIIEESVKEIEVVIIGKENPKFQYAKKIRQVGYVPDIRPYVQEAKVFFVPLRVGGGTRLKILDAMAMGKAIVSTSIGCEGLAVENGKHILIEDRADGFARRIIELMNDDKKREFLEKNARELAENKYDWKIIGKEMEKVYSALEE